MRLLCTQPLLKSVIILFTCFIVYPFNASFAQSSGRSIKGVISDSKGNPVSGVTVKLKNSSSITASSADGSFAINGETGETLVISAVNYFEQEIVIGEESNISIVLKDKVNELNDVVVIGYGTQRKKDLTGSVSTIDQKVITKVATNDVFKAIQGQMAGVNVNGSGQPGAGMNIQIRGASTLNNNNPLYIVDGIQTPVNDLVTSDIESIQVLKDGSAAAIYGVRAMNGVVLITTKRGKTGKAHLDYSGYYGVQNITNRYDVANTQEYQMLVNEASVNAGVPLKPANDPQSPYFVKNTNTDWQSEVFKTGKIQEHTLGVSGGTDAAKYYLSMNYFDHQGTVEGQGPAYKRYSFRVNSDYKQGKFKFGESMAYSKIDQHYMSFLHIGNILQYTVNAIPTLPVYDTSTIDGYGSSSQTINGSYTANPVGFNTMLTSQTERFRFNGNVYGEYEIIKNLKYRISLAYERTDWHDNYFEPIHDLGWFYVNNIAKLDDNRGSGSTSTIENTITYDYAKGQHKLTALVGNTVLDSKVTRMFGHAEGFSQPYFPTLSNGATRTSLGDEFENRLQSYFGRVNYIYADKYLVTATIRADGSSRFPSDSRWGYFPSVAVGWKLNNEAFMQNILPSYVNQLKIRASYGILGNQELPNYAYQAYINGYASAVFGNQQATGATQYGYATPDLSWETKTSRNIAVDVTLFNKLNFTAEYYNNLTEDILLGVQVPGSTGLYPWEAPQINGASIRNSGFEFQAGYNGKSGKFNYSINGNISTLTNEVLALGYGNNPIYGYGNMTKTDVGHEVGEFYGYVIDGIFQTQSEIDGLNAKSPIGRYQEVQTSPGDYKFKDLNGDGKIDDNDRTYLGSALPKLYYGFNISASYKQFELSVVANGASGNKIFNTIASSIENGAGWDNYSKRMLNRWTPDNPNTDVPRVVIYDPNQNGRASSRWLEDGSYLRISSLQLAYNLPEQVLNNWHMSKLRVYVSAQNLITVTGYTGFDPDFANNDGLFNRGIDNGSYPNRSFTANEAGNLPNPRTFILGVQIGL